MGFGLSDIIACATLAWHIYNIGFSKYESASKLKTLRICCMFDQCLD